ncbi:MULTISPECIES: cation transporter [Streptomyces]|uniref:Copper-binding protein n=1 Tax=Streptomyces katrae TaxID=68223 RepID=A0A0F4JLD5_9ACTN|nr:cation transporter [Streptomyces katrae]KJY34990.1 copper-binding protein [Streptomyces katrae]MCF3181577.1 heavy-metal-associated domain-containing protein [Streptomyces polychromogenes]
MSSCCSPDGACASNGETTTTVAVVDSTATVYRVSGMSCGHCRTAITASVGALAGVLSVDVDVDGGVVTVTTAGEPDDAAIAAAVDDAGYELTGRA